MMRLEENFESSPHLATYVRSFEIWLWDGWISNRPHPRFFHVLSKITARLAHVRTLMIYGTEIHSKSNQPYVDWKQITGNLDPDIQDTGIAIEKMLVGERLRYLETRGILNFPFTRFLERCRVVELTDDRAYNIAICAVEMFRDPTFSNAPSVRSYTLSRIVCMDRRIMPGIETACAHARNPSGPLSVNLSTMTTFTVTWNKQYDIMETKKLVLLGRSIEILSIIGEETICFHEYTLMAVKVQEKLKFIGLAKFFSSTAHPAVRMLNLQNIPWQKHPYFEYRYDKACSQLSTELERIDLRGYESLEHVSITLFTDSKSLRLDQGELERLDGAISCNFASLKRLTVKFIMHPQQHGHQPGVEEYRARMATLCKKYGSDFVLRVEEFLF